MPWQHEEEVLIWPLELGCTTNSTFVGFYVLGISHKILLLKTSLSAHLDFFKFFFFKFSVIPDSQINPHFFKKVALTTMLETDE